MSLLAKTAEPDVSILVKPTQLATLIADVQQLGHEGVKVIDVIEADVVHVRVTAVQFADLIKQHALELFTQKYTHAASPVVAAYDPAGLNTTKPLPGQEV